LLDAIEPVFVAFISVAVPVLMVGLVLLIIYAVYREVRGGE
jgi:hypothetical protein